ncbi:zinc ribbon domain-containing protein YjdM [Orbus sturtevantii]|uniref:zinc ribbon domain-containing protein YjdM n=1 Tax=Orbus sturtevantii TaxID=3074109 RepID=UPI00370DA336
MNSIPNCPICQSEHTYQDGSLYICPECAHEWDEQTTSTESGLQVKDSNGNLLADGDDIILIKDLKLKGSSTVLKKGAKAKSIRLVEGDHEIDCKVDGMKIMLKACFVKKA